MAKIKVKTEIKVKETLSELSKNAAVIIIAHRHSTVENAEKIIRIAEKYDLKFSCLAVEILEDKNITGQARKQMIDNLSILKEKGISVLLDDFGSGYTTFGDLQNLDISIVEIDKSITQNSVTDTGFIILKNMTKLFTL